LPMLHITGMTATNLTFTAAIAFINRETTDWYGVARKSFLDLIGPLKHRIQVVITDREVALANALQKYLPNAKQQYCTWHLRENIKHACDKKNCFEGEENKIL
ncbi:hypothetical protein TREMEDRAFT_19040, partial [Tremella mesenterica DSM 1558]|uniref:uncharacterized protein n=1 Tax=Tremella mesenterica (strain ATCC 24925 / CBS 8224 / DSM 1558 / NBRC 9311 / NRRL Y-6157 / RJB 2259-6 / UBC 559-6) TaxID=578456 RepID=UPI00032CACF7